MKETANIIQTHQYPDVVIPNEQSFQLLFDLKLPMLIFFNNENENPIIDILKMAVKQYKEYFVLMIVDYTDLDLDEKRAGYLKDFLGVIHSPAIRILKIT